MSAGRSRRFRLPRQPRRRGGPGWPWPLILILGVAVGAGIWVWLHRAPSPRPAIPGSKVTNTGSLHGPAEPRTDETVPRPTQVATNRQRPEITPSPGPPMPEPGTWSPRSVTNVLEAQIALATHGISGGSIDGAGGAQTAAALRAFQLQHGLEQTGRLDQETLRRLRLERPPFTTFTVTAEHIARLVRIPPTWLGKSELPELGYESVLELAAEQAHSHPSLLRRLNPELDWGRIAAGTVLTVPDAGYPNPRRAARMRVSLSGRYLRAFDERGELLGHFPCSIGRIAEKRPIGGLHVVVMAKDPNYTFDPKVFPESTEGRALGRRLVIPPGPNNPVGVAWLGLDRPGYGIHGTPGPEQVGRTESHGCFRLANWNAELLRQMAWIGMPVSVEP